MSKKFLTSLKFPNLSTAPSSPEEGECYYDTDVDQLMLYTTAGWVALATGSPVANEPKRCQISGTAQSVANASAEAIKADNADTFDNDTMHNSASSNTHIVATTAGTYLFEATISWAANSTGERRTSFRVDGTTTYDGSAHQAHATAATLSHASALIKLTANQYVEVMGTQRSGGALNGTLVRASAIRLADT